MKTQRWIGYILLTPALLSVLLFIGNLLNEGEASVLNNLSHKWAGGYSNLGGGYTSALPFYFGLMAIAGAYLIKGNYPPDKKKSVATT